MLVLAMLVAGVAVAAWLSMTAVRSVAAEPPPPPPPPTETAPQLPTLKIVFPEGFTRKEMARRVAEVNRIARENRQLVTKLRQQQYLNITADHPLPPQFAEARGKPLEGFLFPATYDFTPETTTRQLVERQLEAFERAWAQVDMAHARSKNLTPYEVLIIASMVEKETVAPQERPLVAAVIYNRLRIGMPLGIDATIRYGLDVPGTDPLRQSHLQSDNPYNTRNRLGLPPTPIANPGLASMQAAAHPADVDYLYFVRKPDNVHHFFTASESEFYAKACEYGYGCG
ncbi:MAG TPA: endolytic transglycosylase MltG [Gaiellaceae bacterium]|nr:endolytic transglycosylase MltG [Gaiellaceae bacterium]